jgi:hypothetical protein
MEVVVLVRDKEADGFLQLRDQCHGVSLSPALDFP